MMAGDGREYALAMNFDALTYKVSGNGVDQSGTFSWVAGPFKYNTDQYSSGTTAYDLGYQFAPGNASSISGANTLRFSLADGSLVGELPLAGGTVPFVATRDLLTSVTAAAGTYNLVGRTVDNGGGAPNTTIQQARITAAGDLVTCDDGIIYTIEACPIGSQTTGAITVDGTLFTAHTPSGDVRFRVAQIGADKVFLRASQASGVTRRFVIGTPAGTTFVPGTFMGPSTGPAWGMVQIQSPNPEFTTSFVTPGGTGSSTRGSVSYRFGSSSLGNVLYLQTATGGSANFYAIGSGLLSVMVATRDSTVVPGYLAIGVRH